MKNIAIVIPSLTIGGCERSVSNISLALEDYCKVYVVLFNGGEIVYPYGGKIIDLSLPSSRSPITKIYNSFARYLKIKRFIKKEEIQIVYMFLGKTNLVNYLRIGDCKKIVSCRGYGDMLRGEKFYRKMLKSSDAIIFNSRSMKEYFTSKYPGVQDKTFSAYNLFDFDLVKMQASEAVEKEFDDFARDRKLIVSVGRFCKEKAFVDLIKAFRILNKKAHNIGLVLIGDGELYFKIKNMVAADVIKNDILFLGYQNNPYKYIARSDLYALSSINEGFPNVVVEAMACGLPVVCTNCDSGPNEILNSDFNPRFNVHNVYKAEYGILTPCFIETNDYDLDSTIETHGIFAEALEMMLVDEDLNLHYSHKSIERAAAFSSRSNVGNYINIFREISKR